MIQKKIRLYGLDLFNLGYRLKSSERFVSKLKYIIYFPCNNHFIIFDSICLRCVDVVVKHTCDQCEKKTFDIFFLPFSHHHHCYCLWILNFCFLLFYIHKHHTRIHFNLFFLFFDFSISLFIELFWGIRMQYMQMQIERVFFIWQMMNNPFMFFFSFKWWWWWLPWWDTS